MKRALFLISTLFIFGSCNKDRIKMKVVKDCTGVYLNENGIDHLVCNKDLLAEHEAGSTVKVSFELVNECYGLQDEITCMLYHPFQDKIEITKIY